MIARAASTVATGPTTTAPRSSNASRSSSAIRNSSSTIRIRRPRTMSSQRSVIHLPVVPARNRQDDDAPKPVTLEREGGFCAELVGQRAFDQLAAVADPVGLLPLGPGVREPGLEPLHPEPRF